MHTNVNWTEPINWLIATVLLIVLIGQFWFIFRNRSLANRRKWLRTGLNFLLWLVLVGYFLQIRWNISQPPTHALLVADNVLSAVIQRLKDSLRIQESFNSRNFKPDYDSITLVGQNFPTQTLTQLSNANLQWIPYNQPDHLQTIRWKGIVQQGELQHVTGRILSSKKQTLRLRFGNQTLDSVALHEGENPFSLRFPASAQGRSQIDVALGTTALDTLRFFTRKTEPLMVQFLLNSPDFESKTLADWLGKHGHTVQLSATLSKQISSNVSINKPGKSPKKTVPDLIITEPANANNVAVRKAIADGKSVLFINLTNPETDLRRINQALGSRWQARKITNELTVPVGKGLTALPYRFADNLSQFVVPGYPVAVQQASGRVGVSLLSETYPLSLSGDSVTYNRIWMAVLAQLSSPGQNAVEVEAPIYSGLRQAISVNNPASRLSRIRVGNDTLPLTYSPINERLAKSASLFSQAGWQPVQDSLWLYVEELGDPLRNSNVVSQFMQAHAQYQTITEQTNRNALAKLPDWAWLLLIIVCFTALWIEPKFY